MKNFILILFLILTTCSTPAYSQDNKTLEYPSLYIAQWVYQCSQVLYPTYQRNGAPQQYAIHLAAQSCSCVIDEFRKNFLWLEVQTMSAEDRALFSENYAVGCSPYGRSL